MSAGGPGDHPLSDILKYELPVYGQQADELIRKIGRLSSRRELYEWWDKEIGWKPTPQTALLKSQLRHVELVKRASEAGWELPKD